MEACANYETYERMAAPLDCICGQRYADFRTGLTFGNVRAMMFTASEDRKDWRQKRRRCVLGYWHELKREMYLLHHQHCEERS